jgi:hypothetical protein
MARRHSSAIIRACSCSQPNSTFVIDLETIKALGLTMPNTQLVTTDEVIKALRS